MKLIRLAILMGLLTAVPICAMIYLAVDRLEKSADDMGTLREIVEDLYDVSLDSPQMAAGLNDDAGLPSVFRRDSTAFPFARSLTNENELSLDVVVTGRSDEGLHFLSLRDNRSYHYPIERLAPDDRAFARGLPTTRAGAVYPVVRKLTDRHRRTLVAVIVGRSQFDVVFQRLGEEREHVYPINQLSDADRAFVFGLPTDR